MMGSNEEPPKVLAGATTTRYKCAACFKQYKKKEHLIEHMKTSYHSVHQPKCAVCQKYFKSFESLREHTNGPLSKASCSRIFAERGCSLCMRLFDCVSTLSDHKDVCCLRAPFPHDTISVPLAQPYINISTSSIANDCQRHYEAVAIDCEMVGGGSNGSLDLCARVCLVDEDETLLFHTYVLPQIPVTNYRYEVTGIKEEHLRDATPLKEVQERILQILCSGESIERACLDGGKAKVLVGHNLESDLDCLRMNYPDHLLRDTAKYRPLMKTNLVSHSLKYLTKTFLGYDIQTGVHDPYEDCVSAMRLYKRMRLQDHPMHEIGLSDIGQNNLSFTNTFNAWKLEELKKKTPDELFEMSRSNYRCWCLDSTKHCRLENQWPPCRN